MRREPQLAQARARVRTAEVAVSAAELDLSRTRVVAPLRARVERRQVELGSRVAPGSSAGSLAGLGRWRARLSVANVDRPFLMLDDGEPTGEARLDLGGVVVPARVERSAAGVDERTQTLSVFAYVEGETPLPLVSGEFVRAVIEGRPIEGAAVLPRAALRTDDRVLVLGGDSRVFLRDVVVARRGSESIVVTAGLEDGERVVVSPLPIAADGMRVRVVAGQGAEVEQGS
ncbi:MAG: efflux RND transporter periplasmic adaptor subunit [Planctomycetota bacterium]